MTCSPRRGLASVSARRAAEDRAGRAFGHRQPSRVGRPDRLRSGARLHGAAVARREARTATCAPGDVILGAGRDAPLGSQLLIFGKPHIVYGTARPHRRRHPRARRLHDLRHAGGAGRLDAWPWAGGAAAVLQPGKVTGFLVELAPGATPLQARFAILSTLKGVKVVTGDSTLSGIRQGLAALLNGILALMVLMFASTALMVSVLFSAIVTERRGELGLLKAIGARRGQIDRRDGGRGGDRHRRRRRAGRHARRAGDAPLRALAGLLPREYRRAVRLARPAAHGGLRGGGDRAGLRSSARWARSIRPGGPAGAMPTTSCAARAERCCPAAACARTT